MPSLRILDPLHFRFVDHSSRTMDAAEEIIEAPERHLLT